MKSIRFNTIFIILGVITFLCLLSPFAIGLYSANTTYDGNCYGITDGARPCSWWEFAQNQMLWGTLIAFSPLIFLLMGWLTALGLWVAMGMQPTGGKIPIWQAVLIPLTAFALGIFLIYIIPIVTGLRR